MESERTHWPENLVLGRVGKCTLKMDTSVVFSLAEKENVQLEVK